MNEDYGDETWLEFIVIDKLTDEALQSIGDDIDIVIIDPVPDQSEMSKLFQFLHGRGQGLPMVAVIDNSLVGVGFAAQLGVLLLRSGPIKFVPGYGSISSTAFYDQVNFSPSGDICEWARKFPPVDIRVSDKYENVNTARMTETERSALREFLDQGKDKL